MRNISGRSVENGTMPRWVHRAYAWLMGYFWLPCPICERNFGGHEVRGPGPGLMETIHSGKCVCPNCLEEASRLNKQNFGNYC